MLFSFILFLPLNILSLRFSFFFLSICIHSIEPFMLFLFSSFAQYFPYCVSYCSSYVTPFVISCSTFYGFPHLYICTFLFHIRFSFCPVHFFPGFISAITNQWFDPTTAPQNDLTSSSFFVSICLSINGLPGFHYFPFCNSQLELF